MSATIRLSTSSTSQALPISGSEGVIRTPLPNGSVLLIKQDPSADVVSLNIWVEAGSIDEKADERGMAHLIEHMIFKGTHKRGVGEISREVEAAGGFLNAFTSFEHTCYYVVLPSAQIDKALDVQLDAYTDPVFDAEELTKEKEVVFEEMRMRSDDPWSWSWELLFKNVFAGNPYHYPVIGDEKVLQKVPREKLLRYYKAHYVPRRTVIVVVGNIKPEEVASWVKKHFGKVPSPAPPTRRFKNDPEPKSLKLCDEPGDLKQTYLSLGFPTVPFSHPDGPSLEVLESILGEGASSRLTLAIREGTRSADEVASDHFSGKYGGLFVLQGLTDAKRSEAFVSDLMAILGRMSVERVEPKELEKIKTRVRASKIFEKQSMDGMAKSLGYWELQGGFEMEDTFLRQLDAVTPDDLKRVCAKYLFPKRGTLVFYRPRTDAKSASAVVWQKQMETAYAKGVEEGKVAVLDALKPSELKRIRLQGGGTLLVKERHGLPVVSMGLFFDGGFRDENPKQYGLTSLMTKCLLKGSGGMDNAHYNQALEALAARLDTVTEKDYWGLTLDVLTPHFEDALGLMAQAITRPSFDAQEVVKERDLQKSLIQRLPDDPEEYGLLKSDVLTFAGTPYAHTLLGEEKTVGAWKAGDVGAWYKARVGRKGLTILVVGDVNPEELKVRLESLLGSLPSGTTPSKRTGVEPKFKTQEYREVMDRRQSTVLLGIKAPAFDSKDYFTLRVLGSLLNGMGARLFVELREKRSLAYSVFSAHEALSRSGIYQAYIGCAPQKEAEAREGLLQVLRSLADEKVSDQELDRAKTYISGLYQVGLQSNRSQMASMAKYEMTGPGAEWVTRYPDLVGKVTAEDVQETAKKLFQTDNLTWVVLGPDPKALPAK
jgi:zinc protease